VPAPAITPATEFAPPKDATEVRDALGKIMADVHSGVLDTKRATTAVYASMALLKAFETPDFESRIRSLEEKVNARVKKQN
jgi:hypothetical protein